MVAQTRHGGQPSPKHKLAFHEKLGGKGLTTDALLKKLKALHSQLAQLDQELVDVSTLGTARKELINTSILLHKDRGVKAYAACCLADILRLYAPDAPYTQSELRDIFQFFFRQLTNGLKGTDSSYYNEYFHLLESLSTVKSVVLVCDLPSADELMAEIFRDFFSLVRRDLAKKIEIFMADILVALVDECQTLPSEVLEVVMAQFMDENATLEQPSYRLAVQVCNATADKLQRHVSQYFSDIIVANSRKEEFDEIRTAHDLIKRLHHSCPGLLHSVIPQLEEELRVEDLTLRTIATQVLGEMYADKGGLDLVKKYPSTWNIWLSRRNDKSVVIRVKFVEAMRGLIVNLPDLREELEKSLEQKTLDPDEKVRAALCKLYSQLDYETALHHVSESQLRAIAGRGLDKKQSVRAEALNSLGRLFSLAYSEIESNDPSAITQFAWIPDEILQITGVSQEIRSVVEQVISDHILPLPSSKSTEIDENAWTDRLLNILRYLQEKSIKSLLGLSGLISVRPAIYDHFIDGCIQNNGGIIDEDEERIVRRLNAVTQHLAGTFPDPHKASEDLHAFAKLNENRLYKLLKTCMDPQTDIKGVVKATNEFQKRLEQVSANLVPTMSVFLRRASYLILNQSSIPFFIKRLQKAHGSPSSASQQAAKDAQTMLTFISKHSPSLYKHHVGELAKAISDEKNPRLVEACLQALASVAKWDSKLILIEKKTIERITDIALGSNARHAKFAARFLAFLKNKDEICVEVIDTVADGLASSSEEDLIARITVLAQTAKYAPNIFEQKSDVIMAFLLKRVLLVPTLANSVEEDDDEEWVEDEDVSNSLKAKILSLKVCRNRCLAHATSDKALEIATPVFKMIATLLEQNGSLSPDVTEDPKVMSRMRLQAAISILHLFTIDIYATIMMPKFLRLAVVVQDSCFNVRVAFLTKLVFLLQPRKLPPSFNVIPFLTVHDPEDEVKSIASTYVKNAIRKMTPPVRIDHFEIQFVRLLHLLAHHPDFNTNHDDLVDIAKYVQFYLDLMANSESVSLLYHLAMKGKTVGDKEEDSDNFYVMCELAQELINNRAHLHSWSIQSYPGKVKLPSDILRPLGSPEMANKNVKKVYLPDETRAWLKEPLKATVAKEKRERKPPGERKRKAPAKSNGHAKRPRSSANKWNSDESDEEEPSAIEDSDADMDVDPKPVPTSGKEADDDGEKPRQGTRTSARTRAKGRTTRSSAKRGEAASEDD